ncbi:3-hydroxyisobutyrate dehydrogenase [Chryseobacterium bernardetii]|uniref:3-hydroxyisobutyrate dehydrogenase n=2 Tax=Chryseobacterium TaxID=59732 RepID=A0A543EIZ2_9FLAO|nr:MULTISPECIES: NAD(P)-dependent oxidoreductase [Chryseobacterium]MDR6369995.1 3-hydroxyisobutyrate dehydrogenase [Chryseobacterium vietnamense]MDR6440762.1 3-hydroxyisobutyrate dehydrogenase [Chryseobacterium bernardetii]TQM21558.1 3-hydroxyisobutyrate dehydrogenase [Chryseobacterium aquifrigidense]
MEKIGFIGLGNMGHPMAKNIEKAGFPLSVYNRSVEKAKDFEEKSTVYTQVKDLVQNSDVIFTMLTNDSAVKAVYEEIIPLNIQGKLFVDMSTISLEASAATSAALKIKEASFIDAPVAGSTQPAQEGTLIIMAGGEEKDIQRAMPYLLKMGKSVKHLGENGKGIAGKLSINYFLSAIYQGLAETVLLAGKLGVERSDMLEIINESASGSGATKVKTPLLTADKYAPAFALDLMLKDIRLAKDAGADYPLSETLIQTYQNAHNTGFGQDDVIGIINYLKTIE